MNKKLNTLFFVLGATVVNILITIGVFLLLFVICAKALPTETFTGVLPFIFIAALAASFFIYNAILKIVTQKVDMDAYFDPIFKRGRKK
jgi:hypothetical protein